jgi:hypothetical protein
MSREHIDFFLLCDIFHKGMIPKENRMTDLDTDLLKESEAAAYLNIPRWTLTKLRKRNEGPKWKRFGNSPCYFKAWLDEWKVNLATDVYKPRKYHRKAKEQV